MPVSIFEISSWFTCSNNLVMNLFPESNFLRLVASFIQYLYCNVGIGKYFSALESKISKLDASLNSSSESLPTSDVRSVKKSKSVWDEHNKASMSSKRQSRRPARSKYETCYTSL